MKREYRSRFEERVGRKLKSCEYEPYFVPYQYKAVYLPDFIPKGRSDILIECKGFFRNKQESRKYVAVADSNPDLTIVFILMNPKRAMPGVTKRKDGTKYSMAEWCDNHDFPWYTEHNLPKEFCK